MPSSSPDPPPKSVVFSSDLNHERNNIEDDIESLQKRIEEGPEKAGNQYLDGSESENENEELLYPSLYPVVFAKLKQTTPPRKWCLRIVANPWFERASMFVIIVNCVTLGLYQPCEHSNDLHCDTTACTVLEICDHCVFAFFAAEMVIKMIAVGVWGKRGYLGESWNILDMVIVFFGVLEYLLQTENVINFTSIRTVRVLRPLRAINRVPSMRILVMLLLDTLPMLGNVLLLCFFVFFAFGVVAVQLWSGMLRQRCSLDSQLFNVTENGAVFLRTTNTSVPLSAQFSFDEEEAICAMSDEPGEFHCWDREIIPITKIADVNCTLNITAFQNGFPADLTQRDSKGQVNCIDWNQYYSECTGGHDNPFKGAINFDNVLYAWVTIFQVISLEGWVDIMYHVMDAHSFYSFIYFILLIVIGSFFMINLCLVVIATQFSETKQREQKLIDEQRLKFKSNDSTLASYSPPGNFYEEIFKAVAHVYRKNKRKLMRWWRRWKINREEQNKHNKPPKRKSDVHGGKTSRKNLKSVHYHHHHHHHHHYHISETAIDNPTRLLKALDSPNKVLEEADVVDLQESKSSPLSSACRMITDGQRDSIDPVTSKIALRLPFPTLSNGSSMRSVSGSMTSETRSPNLSERRQSAEVVLEPTGAIFINAAQLNQGSDETKTRFQKSSLSSSRYDSYVTSKLDCSCRFYDVSNQRFEPGAEEVVNDVPAADEERSNCCVTLVRFLKTSKKKVSKCISNASQRMKRLVDSKYYNQGIMAAILVNTLSMGIEHHKQDPVLTGILETSNIVFTTIFALEMASKLFAYGIIGYIKNFYNVFDAIIVIISIWEICVDTEDGGGGLSVLRTFRLLRVLKLVRFLPALRRQLVVLMKTMDNVFTFMMLLALFIFIFSILGMHLFGCKFCWKNSRGTTDCDRKNFDSLLWAFVTVFQILTQEDWNMVLYNGMAASSPYAAIYFVTLMTIGNYVLFNLLVAILVEGFQAECSSEGAQKIRQLRSSLAEPDGSSSDIHILAEEYTNRVAQSLGLPVPSLHTNKQQADGLDDDEEEEYMSTDEDTDIELQLLADNPEITITNDDHIDPTMQNNMGTFKGLHHPLPIITRTSATPTSSPTPCGTPDIQLATLTQSFKDGSGDVFQDESDDSQRRGSVSGTPVDQSFSVQLSPEGLSTTKRPRLCSVGSSLSAESSNLSRNGSWRSRRKKPPPLDQRSLISWKDDECGYEEESEELLQTLRDPLGQSCSLLYPHEVKSSYASSLNGSYSDRGSMSALSFNFSKTSRASSMIHHQDDCSPTEESSRYSIGCWGCKVDLPRFLMPKRDWALFLLSPTNLFRRLLLKVVASKWFDYVILMFIFGNCITIAMDRPSLRPGDPLQSPEHWSYFTFYCDLLYNHEEKNLMRRDVERYILDMLNYVFIGVFTVELLLKVLAYGFCVGPKTYMKSGWNVLDFFLVVTSLVDIVLTLTLESGSKGLGVLRGFRLLRALRPLRVINRASGLKLVVQTLISSLKPIGNIVAICCAFFIIFGILGVQIFKGKFYHCEGEDLFNVTDKWSCKARNYTWVNERYNFDNLGQALMSLFVLSSKDGWVEIMYSGIDAVGVDQQPQENYNPPVLIFFISFLLIVGFFVINMFVGVVVENFHRCREEHELEECRRKEEARQRKQEKLLRKQSMKEMRGERQETLRRKTLSRARSYAHGARGVLSRVLRSLTHCCGQEETYQDSEHYYASYGKTRLAIHKLCTDTYFELAVSAVIGVNILTMAAEHYQQPDALTQALKYANYVFTAVFVVEALIKLIAFGVCRYFKDRWNWLDMIIVLGSLLGIFIEDVWSSKKIPINPTIIRFLRVLRIARVVKLFKVSKGILALLQTVACALPQVVNLGVLFMLLFFTFAALGVELFGTLTCDEDHPCDGLNRLASFRNFGIALLTLFRISTGDNWNGIMKDTLREDCDSKPDCIENCCVSNIVVPIYFVVFVMMAQFVLVNVVVAVLMKQLEESRASNFDDDKEDCDDVFGEGSEEKEQEEKSGIEISDLNSNAPQKRNEGSLERDFGVINTYVTNEDDVPVEIAVVDCTKTNSRVSTPTPSCMESELKSVIMVEEEQFPTNDPITTGISEVFLTQSPLPKEENSSQNNDVIKEQTKHLTCSRQSSEIIMLPPPPPPTSCSASNNLHVSGCRSVGTSPKRRRSDLHGSITSRAKSINLPGVLPCYSSKSTNELSSVSPTPTPNHRPLKNCCSAPSSGSRVATKSATCSDKADSDTFPTITPDKHRRIKRHLSDNPMWVRSSDRHLYYHHHYHLPIQSLARSVSNCSVSPQTAAPIPANTPTHLHSQNPASVEAPLLKSVDAEHSLTSESLHPNVKDVNTLLESENCNSEAGSLTNAEPVTENEDETEPLLNPENLEDPPESISSDKSSTVPSEDASASTQNMQPSGSWVAFEEENGT